MAESNGGDQINHHVKIVDDKKLRFGNEGDATIRFNSVSNQLEIDPKVVGTSALRLKGALHKQKFEFNQLPVIQQDDTTVASGVDTEVNILKFDSGLQLAQQNIGTQTLLQPAVNAAGLNFSYDLTNNDGIQWVMKANGSRGIEGIDSFTIGTSPAFFASLKFKITDVSGSDEAMFGFIKEAAFQAAAADYTDKAVLSSISGDIKIVTALNNAADTTTDTTDNWADGETHTLKVLVSAAGVVTYQIDGVAPTATAAFTFDTGDVVTPFFRLLHDSDVAETTVLIDLEVGLQ